MKPSAKKPIPARPKKPAKTKIAKPRGNISAHELKMLIMAAREAYLIQDPGVTFDDWRAEQVQEAVNRPGLTACDHQHFCDLMGRFKTASGKEDEALAWYLKGGKNTERQMAWSIVEILTAHISLAYSTVEQITAATPPRALPRRLARHEAILDHAEGALSYGYLFALIRAKTRRPDLDLIESDLKAILAERCTLTQLIGIRNTLVNRINEREGLGQTSDRNRSQKSPAAKAKRSPHTLAPRF